MKKKNIIVIGITSVVVIFVVLMGFYAMGNGRNFNYLGKYNKMTSEEREKFRQERGGMGMMRGNYGSGNVDNKMMGRGRNGSGNMMGNRESYSLSGTVIQKLNDEEKNILSYGYSEELLAHDLYTHFYDLYKVDNFKMIADSEIQHIDAVKSLIERYNLQTPTNYGVLQSKYDELKKEGEKGLKEALEVGMKVEMLDIDDISKNIKSTDNEDFKIIFTNIGGASYNHLRSFIKAIENNNFTTNLDYSKYITNDDLNTRGPLNKKLYEKLIGEGVVLPSQVENRGMMR